ncbi:MAG: type II toxin-antitoxin system HicB family antitoxin [Reyranella sp.]|nr:type II toxin-antitoxin system HicB family antitoxin [Reyranella sp.]
MLDACYYSLIERAEDGRFLGWIPDLPGATASGRTEDEVVQQLSQSARQQLHDLLMSGQPPPPARPVDALPPSEGRREVRRLLLIIG